MKNYSPYIKIIITYSILLSLTFFSIKYYLLTKDYDALNNSYISLQNEKLFKQNNLLMATEITTNMFGFGATDTPEFRANNPNFDMKGYNEYINNREYIIGCFYDEANINGRIMLDRNSGFTKYIEGQSNYVPISGIYYSDFDGRATITLTPSQESKFKMYFKVTANAYYITDDIGSSFKKGTCADFYIY